MPVSEIMRDMWNTIQQRGTIGQKAECPALEALECPLDGPEYLVDQWQAAVDRLLEVYGEV